MTGRNFCVTASLLTFFTSVCSGAMNDWAEGTAGRNDGATRDYYNAAARLRWKNFMGDWRDTRNIAQGKTPYAKARIADDDTGKFVEWDVTALVREWWGGKYPNQGFFLKSIGRGGTIVFLSREHPEIRFRPHLTVVGEEGTKELSPQADTYLSKSTYRSQGTSKILRVSGGSQNVLIRFDIAPLRDIGKPLRATLRLYTVKQYGATEIGVFRCRQGHDVPPTPPVWGLASRYPGDRGIERDPNVIFATGFESENWREEWTYAGIKGAIDTVSRDSARRFRPLKGKALRVKIAKGANSALNMAYKFKKETGKEPEDLLSYRRKNPSFPDSLFSVQKDLKMHPA